MVGLRELSASLRCYRTSTTADKGKSMIFANSPVGNFFYRKTLYEMAVEISIEERAQSQDFRCNFYTLDANPA